jgi:hypothetical protein
VCIRAIVKAFIRDKGGLPGGAVWGKIDKPAVGRIWWMRFSETLENWGDDGGQEECGSETMARWDSGGTHV